MHVTRRRIAALCAGTLLATGAAFASAPTASALVDCSAPPSPGVDWSQCYLAGADLTGADLTGANLWKTDLWFANLSGATVSGADLSEADLSDAFVACGDGGVLGVGITGTPAILPDGWTLSGGTLTVPIVPCPPPIPDWVQAYGRDDQDASCRDGWGPSWAAWPNDGAGGFVCQRSIPSLGTSPSSSSAAAASPALSVRTRVTAFPTAGAPFTAVQTSSGAVLVSVSDLLMDDPSTQTPAGIEVFQPSGRTYVSTCLIRLPIEVSQANEPASVMGLRLFADGTWLGAAIEDNGLALYRVADLVACTPTAPVIVSQLLTPSESASGTLDVTFNADSTVAFVDNEYGAAPDASTGGNVGITQIDLTAPGATRLLRQIGTPGSTLAGVTLSPDGTRLYVTTEVAPTGTDVPGSDNPILGGPARCWQPAAGVSLYGLLTVMDVEAAVTGSGDPIVTTIAAGCSPTRVSVSADGSTLYASARGDNRVLAFSADALEGPRPADALLGYATTGPAGSDASEPVGLQLFYNDRLLFVANSNRFANPQQGNAQIFDVTNPADPILVSTIATGLFPRNFTLAADGSTVFLTNYDSNQVQVIRTLVR